jgi:hypothetical protein
MIFFIPKSKTKVRALSNHKDLVLCLMAANLPGTAFVVVNGQTLPFLEVVEDGGSGTANVVFNIPGGRLTTESGVAISTVDRTNQGTLYYTPFIHNNVNTWNGTAWQAKTFSEISLSLTITSGKNYDVFVNSAATALSLSSAWTNDTTRADALGTQDGVTVLASDHTKLWIGWVRASGTNVTEDSEGGTVTNVGGKRFVGNAYNQVTRALGVIDTAASWAYELSAIRQAHGISGNKVEYVTGYATDMVEATLMTSVVSAGSVGSGIGIDTTTSFSGIMAIMSAAATSIIPLTANYKGTPGLGYHYISWNEWGDSGVNFLGGSFLGGSGNSGLFAFINN